MSIRAKTFFLLAVTLLVLAIVADLAAKVRVSDTAVRAATRSVSGHEPNSAPHRDLDAARMLGFVSYCFAALGVASWITSAVRRERCHHAIPIVLFFIFLLVQFVFV